MRSVALLLLALVACGGDKDATDGPPTDTPSPTGATGDTGAPPTTEPPVGPCQPFPGGTGEVRSLSPADDLAANVAIAAAGDTLSLAAGQYDLSAPLVLDKAITLRSADGDPTSVVLDGGYRTGALVEVRASGVALAHLTLQRVSGELVSVRPVDADVRGVRLHDLRLVDPAGRAVVVQPDPTESYFADDGELSCSRVELTAAGRDEVLGLCDTGGFDAEGVRDWTVRDSIFEGLWCDRGLPAPGVRFSRGSRDVRVLRNVLIDSPTGIVVGETPDVLGRRYPDDPCGDVVAQAIDAVVINNIVSAWADGLVYDSLEGIEGGIRAESSCNVRILHNTVVHRVTPTHSSIEHRYPITSGVIGNNLVSDAVLRTDGSTADVEGNLEQASDLNWTFPSQGDFHLAPAAIDPIDAGSSSFLSEVPDDIDGELRADPPDVGADERL